MDRNTYGGINMGFFDRQVNNGFDVIFINVDVLCKILL